MNSAADKASRVEQALRGLLPITELTNAEHEEYLDRFSQSMQEPPTEAQRAYFAELGKHPSAVGLDEHEEYLDRFSESMHEVTFGQRAFFEDRKKQGLGVGLDEDGNVVYAKPYDASRP